MKKMKYRSIISGITAVVLSVFLFTSCEKESGDTTNNNNGDRFEKFSRLTFNSSSTNSSTNSGSGTFSGGGSNSFSTGDGSMTFAEVKTNTAYFADIKPGNSFTDPKSTGPAFGIAGSYGNGGGTFTVDGEEYELDFGFCASQAIGGKVNLPDTSEVSLFVGIQGNWSDQDAVQNFHFIYVISYNKASKIGSFESFYDDNGEPLGAYIVLVEVKEDDNGDITSGTYFGTSGDISIDGSNIVLDNVKMKEVTDNELGTEVIDFRADFKCVSYTEESK